MYFLLLLRQADRKPTSNASKNKEPKNRNLKTKQRKYDKLVGVYILRNILCFSWHFLRRCLQNWNVKMSLIAEISV